MTFLMRYQLGRQRSPVRLPESWPTPRNKRARRERDFLDSLVYSFIEGHRAPEGADQRSDLLSLLVSAMDEDGTQMTPTQLRDETMTLFLAGHKPRRKCSPGRGICLERIPRPRRGCTRNCTACWAAARRKHPTSRGSLICAP